LRNKAAYGPNIASTIDHLDLFHLDPIVSGQETIITLELKDELNQKVVTDSATLVSVASNSDNLSISGKTTVQAVDGVLNFTEVVLRGAENFVNHLTFDV
jgi:hypothetical protein